MATPQQGLEQSLVSVPPNSPRPTPAPIRFREGTEADRSAVEAVQHAAYARERLLGLEPPPLKADYATVFEKMEVWIAEEGDTVRGVLILDVKSDHLVIWSMAAAPEAQGQGIGEILLDAAEVRATQLGRYTIRLNTGAVQHALVAWYARHGYGVEWSEALDAHRVTHMIKVLPGGAVS